MPLIIIKLELKHKSIQQGGEQWYVTWQPFVDYASNRDMYNAKALLQQEVESTGGTEEEIKARVEALSNSITSTACPTEVFGQTAKSWDTTHLKLTLVANVTTITAWNKFLGTVTEDGLGIIKKLKELDYTQPVDKSTADTSSVMDEGVRVLVSSLFKEGISPKPNKSKGWRCNIM